MAQATIAEFGLQTGTDNTVFATWTWTKDHTDHYRAIWYYATGDGVWFVGNDATVTVKQSIYSAPSNATRVKFKVKPIAKTHKVNKKDTVYWTADWSTAKTYNFKDNPPSIPPVPTVTINQYTLTASLNNLNVNATDIQFQIVKNDSTVYKTVVAKINKSAASYSCTVDAGNEYKVRCRAVNTTTVTYNVDNVTSSSSGLISVPNGYIKVTETGAWSEYSDNVGTSPAAPAGWDSIKALSETSVQLNWKNVRNATSYELEYTTQKKYFDSSNEVQSMTIDAAAVGHAEVTGLESGQKYFFRVRAVNDNGESPWSDIASIVIGKKPAAPTTWSSTTTATTGGLVTLYWVHNSEDNSSQTYAQLELTIGGTTETKTIKNSTDEEEKDKISSYVVSTSSYVEGTKIQWRVRTAGITKEYGDWSVQRTIDIYALPTLQLNLTDSAGSSIEAVTSFPMYISALAGPNTQAPIGYHLSVISNEKYECVDQVGNTRIISAGEAVYSKYFDINEPLLVELSAGNIDLENNVDYTVICVVSMNSGLTKTESLSFSVSWNDDVYEPNAEININADTVEASIKPYCYAEDGTLIEGVTLSVYRREFDGSFVELAAGISNTDTVWVTDPHPALDYARYRIVAISDSTGAVSYYDMPGYPVGEKSAIIQWNEAWTNFDVTSEEELEQPAWSGSMLKLPYNIDVADNHKPDVSLVEYIGREHPVSYYGTQIGFTSTWNMEIVKGDEETLYALRRLAKWMGDVYVREPSGSGYWANITVSFSQKHCELTIPVTFNVTRVEGGA